MSSYSPPDAPGGRPSPKFFDKPAPKTEPQRLTPELEKHVPLDIVEAQQIYEAGIEERKEEWICEIDYYLKAKLKFGDRGIDYPNIPKELGSFLVAHYEELGWVVEISKYNNLILSLEKNIVVKVDHWGKVRKFFQKLLAIIKSWGR